MEHMKIVEAPERRQPLYDRVDAVLLNGEWIRVQWLDTVNDQRDKLEGWDGLCMRFQVEGTEQVIFCPVEAITAVQVDDEGV